MLAFLLKLFWLRLCVGLARSLSTRHPMQTYPDICNIGSSNTAHGLQRFRTLSNKQAFVYMKRLDEAGVLHWPLVLCVAFPQAMLRPSTTQGHKKTAFVEVPASIVESSGPPAPRP